MIPVEHKNISGKNIYIVESHHFAMLPWANLRAQLNKTPLLISLDHHTDTHEPFLNYCYYNNPNGKKEYSKEQATTLVQEINYTSDISVRNAILKLRHDEHIKTAIEANIISKAFIISYQNTSDIPLSYQEKERMDNWEQIQINQIMGVEVEELKRPFTYPVSNLYMPPIAFERLGLGGEEALDYAIENDFLLEKFSIFNNMCPQSININSIKDEYILDIDLDYFHTLKSVNPDNPNFFYNLIKDSGIITIALERSCVQDCKKMYGITEEFDSDELLNLLLKHVEIALG